MADGSHATLGGWEPKLCALCGRRVRVSRDNAMFHWIGGRGVSMHTACMFLQPERARELIRGAA